MIDDLIPTESTLKPRGWLGRVVTTAESASDDVYVTIRGADRGRYRHGPCYWTPIDGDTYPSAGDPCLVLIDDDETPWIVAWQPT